MFLFYFDTLKRKLFSKQFDTFLMNKTNFETGNFIFLREFAGIRGCNYEKSKVLIF